MNSELRVIAPVLLAEENNFDTSAAETVTNKNEMTSPKLDGFLSLSSLITVVVVVAAAVVVTLMASTGAVGCATGTLIACASGGGDDFDTVSLTFPLLLYVDEVLLIAGIALSPATDESDTLLLRIGDSDRFLWVPLDTLSAEL